MSIKLNFKYTEMNWNTCFLPLKRFIRRDGENIKHWCLSFSCWFTGKFSASLPGSDSEGSDHRQKLTAKTDISISSCCCLVFLSTPMSHKSCLNVVIVSYRHGCLKKKKKRLGQNLRCISVVVPLPLTHLASALGITQRHTSHRGHIEKGG